MLDEGSKVKFECGFASSLVEVLLLSSAALLCSGALFFLKLIFSP